MSQKRYNAEKIIHRRCEEDMLLTQGKAVKQICKQLGVGNYTYYRWRNEYGGMKIDQAKQLKELEANGLLRR